MTDLKSVPILVSGEMNPPTLETLRALFDVRYLPNGAIDSLTDLVLRFADHSSDHVLGRAAPAEREQRSQRKGNYYGDDRASAKSCHGHK